MYIIYIITFAIFAIGVLFIIFVVGVFVSALRARKSAAPFFPTPTRAIQNALREAGLKDGEIFYDLGAGTGKALIIAEKKYGSRAAGFEISILFYWIAKINLFLRRSRAKLYLKSFWDHDFHDADVIFCFLTIRIMPKIEEKLERELRPGTRVVVYAFPLPSKTPTKTITVHGQWKMFFYYF